MAPSHLARARYSSTLSPDMCFMVKIERLQTIDSTLISRAISARSRASVELSISVVRKFGSDFIDLSSFLQLSGFTQIVHHTASGGMPARNAAPTKSQEAQCPEIGSMNDNPGMDPTKQRCPCGV